MGEIYKQLESGEAFCAALQRRARGQGLVEEGEDDEEVEFPRRA